MVYVKEETTLAIMGYSLKGYSNKVICEKLGITSHTIATHKKELRNKSDRDIFKMVKKLQRNEETWNITKNYRFYFKEKIRLG